MSMTRSVSAPLRRSRYSSVLESALVGLGREDAVVQSGRKPRKKRRYENPKRDIPHVISANEEEEDPFVHLKLVKSHRRKKKVENVSPVVTRSAAKRKRREQRRGVLEMAADTPMTRSRKKKQWKRSSLEMIEDANEEVEEVVIQKKLFQSPMKKKGREKRQEKTASRKAKVLMHWRLQWPMEKELVVTGQVDERAAWFVVDKRETAKKFTSKEGEYVALSGKFDRDAGRSAGIPRAVMDMMEDGIPAYFCKKLLPFVKKEKTGQKDKRVKPKSSKKTPVKRGRASVASVHEAEESFEAPSTPIQVQDDVFETPKPKKARGPPLTKAKSAKKTEPEPEEEGDIWTSEQLEALTDAKLAIPTTASNFWAQVAQYVPGKSAAECQTKTFEQFRTPPTNRKSAKKPIKRAKSETTSALPSKIARAGSNKFKKQVREFVEEYEKKHVDDLFETTPSKEGLPELPDFDAIKSPELETPSRSCDDDDSEMDDEAPGLLKKLSSRMRDDIDSYVLGINRQHVAGGGKMVAGKVRRVTSMVTPVKPVKANAMSAKKKAVMLVEDVGIHSLKGVVSPGGTTHVRIEKDGSSCEDEDDNYQSSEEEDFDIH